MSLRVFNIKNGAELLANFKIVKIALASKHGLSRPIASTVVETPSFGPETVKVESFSMPQASSSFSGVESNIPTVDNVNVLPQFNMPGVAPIPSVIQNEAPAVMAPPVVNAVADIPAPMPSFATPEVAPIPMAPSMEAPAIQSFIPEEKTETTYAKPMDLDDSGQPLGTIKEIEEIPAVVGGKEEISLDELLNSMIEAIVNDKVEAAKSDIREEVMNTIEPIRKQIEALEQRPVAQDLSGVKSAVIDATNRFGQVLQPGNQPVQTIQPSSQPEVQPQVQSNVQYTPYQRAA